VKQPFSYTCCKTEEHLGVLWQLEGDVGKELSRLVALALNIEMCFSWDLKLKLKVQFCTKWRKICSIGSMFKAPLTHLGNWVWG